MANNLAPSQVGERIEQLLEELLAADPTAASRAEQLVGLLVQMYGDGLERIIGSLGEEQMRELTTDPVISSLLVLHDLHPVDVETRINTALDEVRPYLGSHAGGVEFLGIDDQGVARLRLQGSCDGCPASSVTVKMAIERAILDAAPEVISIDVEGVAEPGAHGETLLQIGTKPQPKQQPKWVELEGPIPSDGAMETRDFGSFEILVATAGDHTYAYRSDCPACGTAVIEGALVGTLLTCGECGHTYDLAAAGRSIDDDLLLDPIPLLSGNGTARVALPEVIS